MQRAANKIIRDILIAYMQLPANNVYLYNQEFRLTNEADLYIVIQTVNKTPYANNKKNEFIATPTPRMVETTCVNFNETYLINTMGKNNNSELRANEVIMALQSQIAIDAMEKYQFKIYPITKPIINLSENEGGSMYNRFGVEITLATWYSKSVNVAHYNNFTHNVKIEY